MEKEVTVTANSTTDISIQLSDAQAQLSEVIVSAGRNKDTIDEVPSSVSIVGLRTLQQNINITTNRFSQQRLKRSSATLHFV